MKNKYNQMKLMMNKNKQIKLILLEKFHKKNYNRSNKIPLQE